MREQAFRLLRQAVWNVLFSVCLEIEKVKELLNYLQCVCVRVEGGTVCRWDIRDVWLVLRDPNGCDQGSSTDGRHGGEEIQRLFPLHHG